MEQEMIWVNFVGGPLHGQSRRLPRSQEYLNACPKLDFEGYDPTAVVPKTVTYVTYKIERHWSNNPNTVGFREWFTGVLA